MPKCIHVKGKKTPPVSCAKNFQKKMRMAMLPFQNKKSDQGCIFILFFLNTVPGTSHIKIYWSFIWQSWEPKARALSTCVELQSLILYKGTSPFTLNKYEAKSSALWWRSLKLYEPTILPAVCKSPAFLMHFWQQPRERTGTYYSTAVIWRLFFRDLQSKFRRRMGCT